MADEPAQDSYNIEFQLDLSGSINFHVEADDLVMTVTIRSSSNEPTFTDSIRFPLHLFIRFGENGGRKVGALCTETGLNFLSTMVDAAQRDLALHIAVALSTAAERHQLYPLTKERLISELMSKYNAAIRYRLEHYMEVPHPRGQGRPSKWDAQTLRSAIGECMELLSPKRRNYDDVSKKLRELERYSKIAPPSGAALKKLVRRFNLDWLQLKRPTEPKSDETQALLTSPQSIH